MGPFNAVLYVCENTFSDFLTTYTIYPEKGLHFRNFPPAANNIDGIILIMIITKKVGKK